MNVITIVLLTKIVPFLYALIGFGFLITIHEFGHFIFCKIFKIHTPTFSIGIGPAIIQKKIGQTNFCLSIIPLGGYLEIAGQAEVGQGEQAHAQDIGEYSFQSKPFWQKSLVIMGGIIFNMLFAYLIFTGLFFTGMPKTEKVALIVKTVQEKSIANQQGLQAGDKILSIDNYKLHSNPKQLNPVLKEITEKIATDSQSKINLKIKRNEQKLTIELPPSSDHATNLQRGSLRGANLDLKPLSLTYESYPLLQAFKHGIQETNGWVIKILSSLKTLIIKRNIQDFGGPIMMVSQSFKMAQRGIHLFLIFLAIISINLAVINILPIGALDGGQLLFETIEVIIRRKIPSIIRLSINLASWVLLLGLILFLSFQDILALFN